eukprot:PITA_33465
MVALNAPQPKEMVALNAPQPTDLLRGCACAVIFTLLLLPDACNAIKRKAYWFPGTFLVLSALTLQFINYVNYTTVKVTSTSGADDDTSDYPYSLVIDSGRIMVYVFIAYLLPGLVSSRSRGVWTNIAALALSVLAHMLSEILIFRWYWFEDPFDCILFTANILLVLLCISAVLAGKTICFIMNQKVPSLLSCCPNSCRDCKNIEDHVLKCWIVVRCSQPEYIMARSVLSSLAGVVVTACVIQFFIEFCFFYYDVEQFVVLNEATLLVQFLFILMAWIVVAFRWITAVIYFPRYGKRPFQVEDFWTRSLIELKYRQLNGLLWEKKDRNRTLLQTTMVDSIIPLRLRTLVLSMAIFVQKFVVLLSKVSLLLSWLLFGPFLMAREKITLSRGLDITKSEFPKYRKVLESIAMPGENAESLWIANVSAFRSTKKHMEQGRSSTKDLIKTIRHLKEKAPVADEGEEIKASVADKGEEIEASVADKGQDIEGSVADKRKEIYGEEEKYLNYFSKMSWKMRAVSLIHFMLCSYDGNNNKAVDDAFKACSEAWALMDFVESSDMEANIVSLAADMEFSTLKNIWKQNPIQSDEKLAIRNRMQEDIKSRISKGESQERVENMHDSVDWMTAAADFSLNKTSKVIESKGIDYTSANAVRILGCLLAKVIVNFLEIELENALIEKCSKWAVDGEEEKMYHASFFAGKAMGLAVLFQTGQDNNAVPPAAGAEGKENDSSGISEAVSAV